MPLGSRPGASAGKAAAVGEAARNAPEGPTGVGVTARARLIPDATREVCFGAARQRRTREGRRRLRQMADGLGVPMKPGNAGGGKGPDLDRAHQGATAAGIDEESTNLELNR